MGTKLYSFGIGLSRFGYSSSSGQTIRSVTTEAAPQDKPTPKPDNISDTCLLHSSFLISDTMVSGMDAELVFPNLSMVYGNLAGSSRSIFLKVSLISLFAW